MFDLDNTITDRRRSVANLAHQLRRDFRLQLAPCRDREIVRAVASVDGDGYKTRPQIVAALLEILPWSEPPTPKELLAYWNIVFPKSTHPRVGLYPLLIGLKTSGVRLAIISNGSTSAQVAKIRSLGILPYFDKVIISEAVGLSKPDIDIFHLALEESI